MKKGTKILLAIGIILLAVGATMINIAHGRGERFNARLRAGIELAGGGVQSGYTVCDSGEVSFDPTEVERLDIDWASGRVRIQPHRGSEVVVSEVATSALGESQKLRYKLSGGELSILPCAEKQLQPPEKHLTVLVPEDWIAESIELSGASAELELQALTIRGALSVDTGSGDVLLAALRAGRVEIDGASARLYLSELDCGDLDLDTGSGDILTENLVCGGVEADSASGDISLAFAEAPKAVDVDTGSGDVTLLFPEGTGIALDFDPGSGKLHGDVLPGTLPVDVDTGSGDLTIVYR